MNSSIKFIIFSAALIAVIKASSDDIDGGLVSTLKIVRKLCCGERTEKEASDFWNCYYAPEGAATDVR